MSHPALIARALAAGITGLFGVGCGTCSTSSEPVPIEHGVDVDLHDVVVVGDSYRGRYVTNLAVGAEGTIISWGIVEAESSKDWGRFVDVTQIGNTDLRAAWIGRHIEGDYDPSNWWVVGDAGTIALSEDHGSTWRTITLPDVDADLYAITSHSAWHPLIVGDDIVLFQLSNDTWAEPPTPVGGWGSLRGVSSNDSLTYAVGLEGRVWSTSDPSGEWEREWLDVEVDLFDVQVIFSGLPGPGGYPEVYGAVIVVGAHGTVLIEDRNGWRQLETGVDVDLIDVSESKHVLGADGSLYELGEDDQLTLIESRPDARALCSDSWGITTVGIDGHAASPPPGC